MNPDILILLAFAVAAVSINAAIGVAAPPPGRAAPPADAGAPSDHSGS